MDYVTLGRTMPCQLDSVRVHVDHMQLSTVFLNQHGAAG